MKTTRSNKEKFLENLSHAFLVLVLLAIFLKVLIL